MSENKAADDPLEARRLASGNFENPVDEESPWYEGFLEKFRQQGEAFAPDETEAIEDLPAEEYSYRGKTVGGNPILPKVRNQGLSNLCSSFAMVGIIESLKRIETGAATKLCPKHIHYCLCRRGGPLAGLNLDYAAKKCRDGVAQLDDDSTDLKGGFCDKEFELLKLSNFYLLDSISNALTHLKNYGPFGAQLNVQKEGSFFTFKGDGIYSGPSNPWNSLTHSVIVVGLDLRTEKKLALVQNSFAKDWGDGGFAKIEIGTGGLLTWNKAVACTL